MTVFEIRFGLERLAEGARRKRLDAACTALIHEDLGGRVLDFDTAAAEQTGILVARLSKQDRNIEIRDAMICGIALARRVTVATRNVRHFEHASVSLVNPWLEVA